jgi:hypothetical protein
MHDFCVRNRSYLGEFEAEFKKGLARESGAQGYCLMKKTEGRKSRDTVPLRAVSSISFKRLHLIKNNLTVGFSLITLRIKG